MQTLISLLKSFIWNRKRARCSHTSLTKHRTVGGMGIVDLHDYLTATHLDHLKHRFNPSTETLWLDIEKGVNKTPNLSSLLYADTWEELDLSVCLPTTRASIQAWRAIIHIPPQ